MKKFVLLIVTILLPLLASAHGPSPQKTVKEFPLKADPAKVWALLKDFGAIDKWHPDVTAVKLETKKDTETDKELPHRLVTLKDGKTFLEKLREVDDVTMKMDYKMLEGPESTIAVSNYRTVIQVKQGANANEAIVTMTGRYYNKANSMEALPGMDNPTANKAIAELYDNAIVGLKKALEK
ncbi:MAG: MxaD protein [Methylotenera sp.]|nr:MAG: MxaD protein [Methylotenera sp.]